MLLVAVIVSFIAVGIGQTSEPNLVALRYLEKEYPFDSDWARRNLASVGNLHRIEDWEINSRLKKYELFYFRSTWGLSPPSYEIIAAAEDQKVLRLRDREDFNTLLAHEVLVPTTLEEARRLVRFYLLVTNISGVVNYDLKEGIRILTGIDDIPFKSDHERQKIARTLSILEPSLESLGDGRFRYVAFSWQREGSGAIDMRTIVLGPKGVLSSETKVLQWGVGMYDAIQ